MKDPSSLRKDENTLDHSYLIHKHQEHHEDKDEHLENKSNDHKHEHEHSESHDHDHGIFHVHTHDHKEGAEQLISALSSGRIDRGTKITLLGLGTNVGLTVSKGIAGLWMNSASLLAEAGHSLSDLLGDFVTLATWRISRKPPTDRFPWGYSKFETIGTLSVSVILIVGGAIGIGLHSYSLLLHTLLPYLESLPPDTLLHSLGGKLPSIPSPLLELFHSHGPSAIPHDHLSASNQVIDAHEHLSSLSNEHGSHDHSHGGNYEMTLNPHAAWFAAGSVLVKEWLYRLTTRVAAEEHSPVLKANAVHHRADALTSLVALGSILGSSIGGYKFLDPLGGLAVSFFILQQGLVMSRTALLEIVDAGVDQTTQKAIEGIVEELVDGKSLLRVRNVRGVRSGGQTHLDLTISVPASMSVRQSHAVESRVREAVLHRRKDVREVKIHVHGEENGVEELVDHQLDGNERRTDFGGCEVDDDQSKNR
ncbi:hypothetical protein TREMEDRAFT_30115 [Tremella mesenterica DSM 1558]|uniref:uncharacterized protein n=1 Tax=Tremella mesenterica (strain ATCC 24925 / CBS 8224 / DSM 1558 / NBRC 9311 / NRRL Y-6157 / RJB 2259-6 / UBC 559-6) TaxID=578456 RepID=UPI0003F4A2EB|nr:uncharacterized protein TREMEDRAFT_30115 [Tremella mesenterica DSM 1558]EIW69831.1 hypothetical protein TREMEDRAFT_30115 [Tremella mesenterica DSM 1558]